MADIRSFKGLYYDPERIESIKEVVAPPYDVIDEKEHRRLLATHRFNIVRLILPEVRGCGQSDMWQEKAHHTFEKWKRSGVFKQSPRPSIYLYRQTFCLKDSSARSRLALIALFKLEDFGSGAIYPHEQTFYQVTDEQLNLLRRCKANFSQVFALFEDDQEYHHLLESEALPKCSILSNFADNSGVRHELLELSDASLIGKLRDYIKGKKIFIADGHHRYETALIYRDEKRESATAAAEAPYDFISMAFVGMNDPGLVLLPVHRLVRGFPYTIEEAMIRLGETCHKEWLGESGNVKAIETLGREVISSPSNPATFGLVTPRNLYLLRFQAWDKLEEMIDCPRSKKWKNLDITILHELIFKRILGMGDPDQLHYPLSIRYTIDIDEVIEEVTKGNYQLGFIVRPPSLRDAWEIAETGEKMPHKSTYFYPKILSGLVIYDHDLSFP